MKKIMFRIIIILICVYSALLIGTKLYYGSASTSLLNQLEGDIYYLKRVDGISTLFKSQANMSNEQLLYSHVGKGNTNDGSNDNIIDFHVNEDTDSINFVAMHEGKWTEYEYKNGNVTRMLPMDDKDIASSYYDEVVAKDTRAYIDEGSIYVTRNNKTTLLKDVGSNYDQNYSTYMVLEMSPDGRYLIYCDSRNFLAMEILDMFLPGEINNKYIIDLETNKVSTYIDAINIVWVQ